MFGNLVVSMLVRGCVDGPAERADVISLQGVSTARRIAARYQRNVLETQELRALTQPRERA